MKNDSSSSYKCREDSSLWKSRSSLKGRVKIYTKMWELLGQEIGGEGISSDSAT
jgi:hypothetical protein